MAAMHDRRALQSSFARDVVLLKLVGMNPVVVHGGGPQIDRMLTRLGKKGEFVQGMRVTDDDTMDVVEMVLGGLVNKDIVTLLNQHGGRAIGLTGKDGSFIRARKLLVTATEKSDELIDIGQVGEVESIDPGIVSLLEDRRVHPCVGADRRGRGWHQLQHQRRSGGRQTGGNPACGEVGTAHQYTGVLDKDGNLLTGLTPKQSMRLFADGTLSEACCRRSPPRWMLPKAA
jgi:acetylglutamate kinase